MVQVLSLRYFQRVFRVHVDCLFYFSFVGGLIDVGFTAVLGFHPLEIPSSVETYDSQQCRHKSLAPSRGGGLGSRPKKMYGERLGDGVEYHSMKPTPRC